MSDNVRDISEIEFDKLLIDSDDFIAVMFYTTTCPNCKAIEPVYSQLSKELGREGTFTKINTEQNTSIAIRYGIMGVPTFKFFCKKQPVGELVGAINTTVLRNTIKDIIRHRNECVNKSTRISYEIDGYG
jgi:thioredoxin-like negative regulator of GroEL